MDIVDVVDVVIEARCSCCDATSGLVTMKADELLTDASFAGSSLVVVAALVGIGVVLNMLFVGFFED